MGQSQQGLKIDSGFSHEGKAHHLTKSTLPTFY